jgi:hypothetical protein
MGRITGLAKEQRRALGRLKAVPGLQRFYLAGGSAVATHLGHRRSLDLDLFSAPGDVDLHALAEAVTTALPEARILGESDVSIHLRVDDVPVDLVRYPYAPLDPPVPGPEDVPVAGLRDLAAMKLAAIARRGLRRDFWDLYALAEAGFSLRRAADAYVAKFGVKQADLYHALRALTYFDDAEKDPELPRGLSARRWETIKAFFRTEAPKLLRAR